MSTVVDHVPLSRNSLYWQGFRRALDVGEIEAIRMPAALGVEVLARLKVHMMVGPVFAQELLPGRWTFVTGPSIVVRDQVTAELVRHGVELSVPVDSVVLSIDPEQGRCIEPLVVDRVVPPWSAVVAEIRSVTATLSR